MTGSVATVKKPLLIEASPSGVIEVAMLPTRRKPTMVVGPSASSVDPSGPTSPAVAESVVTTFPSTRVPTICRGLSPTIMALSIPDGSPTGSDAVTALCEMSAPTIVVSMPSPTWIPPELAFMSITVAIVVLDRVRAGQSRDVAADHRVLDHELARRHRGGGAWRAEVVEREERVEHDPAAFCKPSTAVGRDRPVAQHRTVGDREGSQLGVDPASVRIARRVAAGLVVADHAAVDRHVAPAVQSSTASVRVQAFAAGPARETRKRQMKPGRRGCR